MKKIKRLMITGLIFLISIFMLMSLVNALPPTIDSYTPTILSQDITNDNTIIFTQTSSDPEGDVLSYDWSLYSVSTTLLGNKVFFTSVTGGIYSADIDGTNIKEVLDPTYKYLHIDISPDGTEILTTRQHGGGIEIMIVDGTQSSVLTTGGETARWSPDGEKVLFNCAPVSPYKGEICIIDKDGSNLMKVINLPTTSYLGGWSPDGSKIVFFSESDNNIYTINIDGSNLQQILQTTGPTGTIWSPNEDLIGYNYNPDTGIGPQIYTMNIDGTEEKRISIASSEGPIFSPDGTKIYYRSASFPSDVLYENNLDGTGEKILISGAGTIWSFDVGLVNEVVETLIGAETTEDFTFSQQPIGDYKLILTVSDGTSSDSVEWDITVNQNVAPTIDSFSPIQQTQSINEGDTIQFTQTSSDENGDILTYSWLLDDIEVATTQDYDYVTDYISSGDHNVNLIVSDGTLSATQQWLITVNNVNRAPVLDTILDITVDENDLVTITPIAVDLDDDDELIYTYSVPLDENGEWQTDYDSEGVYDITVTVSDGVDSDIQTFILTVNNVNQLPVLDLIDDVTVSENDLITITPIATDADNDTLTFTFSTPLDENGEWQTDYDSEGVYNVGVTVSDGVDFVTQDFTITINNVEQSNPSSGGGSNGGGSSSGKKINLKEDIDNQILEVRENNVIKFKYDGKEYSFKIYDLTPDYMVIDFNGEKITINRNELGKINIGDRYLAINFDDVLIGKVVISLSLEEKEEVVEEPKESVIEETGDHDKGHGNEEDGFDEDNPGKSQGNGLSAITGNAVKSVDNGIKAAGAMAQVVFVSVIEFFKNLF